MARTILHVDMDAFYVSVELLRRPELRGLPVVVGGTGERGVVAAASYEARRYGVHSALPSSVARRRCPQAVFLPGDHQRYAEISSEVHRIFRSVTPLVEGIALDEAFLDVSGALRLFGTGPEIAERIRSSVRTELELACSVGVAPNKFLAKLASQAAKPIAGPTGVRPGPGVVEVRPGEERAFLHPLPVQRMWGVGPATLEKLQRLGVATVADLAALDERTLVAALGGASGRHLFLLARAIDDRPVEPERAVKSIGHEETYPHDLHDPVELRAQVVRLADAVAARLRRAGVGARTVTLKVRFAGFDTVTRSHTATAPLTTGPAIAAAVLPLLDALDTGRGVRLLGVSGSNLGEPAEQLAMDGLFGPEPGAPPAVEQLERAWHDASSVIDEVRSKFGAAAIRVTSTIAHGPSDAPGSRPWGPDHRPAGPPPPAASRPGRRPAGPAPGGQDGSA